MDLLALRFPVSSCGETSKLYKLPAEKSPAQESKPLEKSFSMAKEKKDKSDLRCI